MRVCMSCRACRVACDTSCDVMSTTTTMYVQVRWCGSTMLGWVCCDDVDGACLRQQAAYADAMQCMLMLGYAGSAGAWVIGLCMY